MYEFLGGFGILGILISLFLLISVYSAQKWAYKSFKELEKLNQKIDYLSSTKVFSGIPSVPKEVHGDRPKPSNRVTK